LGLAAFLLQNMNEKERDDSYVGGRDNRDYPVIPGTIPVLPALTPFIGEIGPAPGFQLSN
jgi:hypothetical protein